MLPDYEHLRLDEVNELSGLSRILSLNDWQRRGGIFAIENNEESALIEMLFLVCQYESSQ